MTRSTISGVDDPRPTRVQVSVKPLIAFETTSGQSAPGGQADRPGASHSVGGCGQQLDARGRLAATAVPGWAPPGTGLCQGLAIGPPMPNAHSDRPRWPNG
jgi:hypothetical protein